MGVLKRIERRKYRKIRKAVKSYRGRFWKNLAIFMAGVFSSGLISAGAVAVVLSAIPLKTIAGENVDKIVAEELADKSILNVLLGIKDYTTNDLVVVNTLIDAIQNAKVGGKELNNFVSIDTSKLQGVKIFELGPALKDAFSITATIESTVGMEMLNEIGIGKITALTGYEKVFEEDGVTPKTVETMDTSAEGFKAKLYYYLVEEGVDGAPSVYARAYKDDGSPADGVTNDTELYYGAITKMPVTDAALLLNDVPSRIKVIDLLSAFNVETTGILGNIIGDRTITELGGLGADSICIYDILGGEEDSDMYRILSDATGKPYNEILASDLTSLDINGIKVSTAFKNASNTMKNMFVDLVNAEKEEGDPLVAWEELTIGDLQGIQGFESIKLSSVMTTTYPTGYMINSVEQTGSLVADLLIESKTWDGEKADWTVNQKWDSLTVNDISGISADKIKLKTVLSTTYPTGYMINSVEQTGSLVADLLIDSKTWDGEKAGWTVNQKWDSLTVNDISGISAEKIKLKTVLSNTYPTGYVKADSTIVASGSTMANILIESKTWDASFDTVNKKWDSLTVNDISSIDFNSVKLSTLGIKANGNKLLDALLADEDVTVSGLGDKINNLKLYDVFGKDCFTTNEEDAVDPNTKFRFEEELYVEDENGTYYKTEDDDYVEDIELAADETIKYRRCQGYVHDNEEGNYYLHENDGMWLLLCFEFGHVDSKWYVGDTPVDEWQLGAVKKGTGRPEEYIISNLTFNDLTSGTAVTDIFEDATIAQLVDAGILSISNDALMPYSLAEALDLIPD